MARILLTDDDELVRVVLGRMLEEAGHDVLYASDGDMALRLAREMAFDAILTDLAMPHFGGLRLIRELREEGDCTPIIAISGSSPEHLILAEDFGANATLMKPMDRLQLLRAVEEGMATGMDLWGGVMD